jgi:hypothetical protein
MLAPAAGVKDDGVVRQVDDGILGRDGGHLPKGVHHLMVQTERQLGLQRFDQCRHAADLFVDADLARIPYLSS